MPTLSSDDTHARMDRLEQRLRQMRASDGGITWDDFDGSPMASLLAKFRMPNIERYMGIGCPRIHLGLYSTIMRAHELDESQMIKLFLMSLSGITQRRELEALRQRLNESVTSVISRWRENIALIIDHSLERDHICMIMRSLQLRLLIHLLHTPSLEHLKPRLLTLLDYRGFDKSGFSELGKPSVTTNPLPTHSTHLIPPPIRGVHFIDLDQDDFIHMMNPQFCPPSTCPIRHLFDTLQQFPGSSSPVGMRLAKKWGEDILGILVLLGSRNQCRREKKNSQPRIRH
ncbi:hypothetical protein CK203_116966 [Vitis vinifera]|uniref:Uncharacterized protein n=1 Tax=Vitis vinifera TaxID=29760 RepID=A0A438CP81_VITVI|nr:hypothetical protein CK203_116966 [Vitis vinifera]